MYQILHTPARDGSPVIDLQRVKSLSIPAHLRVGGKKKIQVFQEYFTKLFSSNSNALMHICHAHVRACETGKLHLVTSARDPLAAVHRQALGAVIQEHHDFLNNITPYVDDARSKNMVDLGLTEQSST